MNPTIVRAIVSDRFGKVLFDSEAPRYWRPGPARPPIVRRYAPPAAPVADPAAPSKISGYILDALGGPWHAESITDVGSKDSLVTLRGKWIVEFSELDALVGAAIALGAIP